MAKFRFRLETVQRIREAEREEKQLALAQAHRAQQELQRMIAEVQQQIVEIRHRYASQAQPGPMNVDQLLSAHRYELGLQSQAQALAEKDQMLAAETDRRREALVEADRQVRVLERLRELHRARHLREEQRRENQRLDEVAAHAARETL